jgi:outer membrane lipopolysaccharide assembly protein LptE/RlpB
VNTRLLWLLVLAAGLVVSCAGYRFAGEDYSVLEPKFRDLALVDVSNPSTYTWLGPRLRSLVRDELTRRNVVRWTDKAKAQSHLYVEVKRYHRKAAVTGTYDQTLKLDATLVMQARIFSAADGSVLWDSREISITRSYFPGEEQAVDDLVADLAVRSLADRMSERY